jgi:threonine/homoserine/homoserine lactone efflux protein
MPIELYLAYLAACLAVVIVPGPTATLNVANSLNHGIRAGLANVAGTQAGLAVFIGILMVGLAAVIEAMGALFDWLRLAGAAYLIWLGWKLLRAKAAEAGSMMPLPKPRGGFFLQGFLVTLSNPKTLLFFGAFIPQFIRADAAAAPQILLLGLTAMACALVFDSAYAVLTARAGRFVSARRLRLASRCSGAVLMGGGLWLAFSRAK